MRSQVKWAVSLVIAGGHFNLAQRFLWYIWLHTQSELRDFIRNALCFDVAVGSCTWHVGILVCYMVDTTKWMCHHKINDYLYEICMSL